MVENIYELKNKILQHVERETENMDRIDVREVGMLVDMVKDLAEAEKECWEASYYRKVTEAMGSEASGYASMPQPRTGSTRQGYGSSASMGRSELIDKIGREYERMSPSEKMEMRGEILRKLK